MSQQESSPAGSARGPQTRLHTQSEAGSSSTNDEPIPPFRPFPARTRDASKGDPGKPSGGTQNSERDSTSRLARGSPHHTQGTEQRVIPYPRPAPEEPELPQRHHTPTLPDFTPFPAAAPSSRYAPPPGSRVELARSVFRSTNNQDTNVDPQQGTNATAGGSDSPIGHLSASPIQYSPYATPGPLTARPHICELCSSGFARAHDLKRHLDTHKGERPHKCPNCQRGFSRKDAVQRHLLLTHCGSASSDST